MGAAPSTPTPPATPVVIQAAPQTSQHLQQLDSALQQIGQMNQQMSPYRPIVNQSPPTAPSPSSPPAAPTSVVAIPSTSQWKVVKMASGENGMELTPTPNIVYKVEDSGGNQIALTALNISGSTTETYLVTDRNVYRGITATNGANTLNLVGDVGTLHTTGGNIMGTFNYVYTLQKVGPPAAVIAPSQIPTTAAVAPVAPAPVAPAPVTPVVTAEVKFYNDLADEVLAGTYDAKMLAWYPGLPAQQIIDAAKTNLRADRDAAIALAQRIGFGAQAGVLGGPQIDISPGMSQWIYNLAIRRPRRRHTGAQVTAANGAASQNAMLWLGLLALAAAAGVYFYTANQEKQARRR